MFISYTNPLSDWLLEGAKVQAEVNHLFGVVASFNGLIKNGGLPDDVDLLVLGTWLTNAIRKRGLALTAVHLGHEDCINIVYGRQDRHVLATIKHVSHA